MDIEDLDTRQKGKCEATFENEVLEKYLDLKENVET